VIKVAYGSFTTFHRCYINDELYKNETDESIDLFKNNYMGRVVIATGKIKTDFSRPKETENEPIIETDTGLPKPIYQEDEMMTIFYDEAKKKVRTTHFGASGYEHYSGGHQDLQRKQNNLGRHME
jgi:hypothetical protein